MGARGNTFSHEGIMGNGFNRKERRETEGRNSQDDVMAEKWTE
jgi:hypothetical protein